MSAIPFADLNSLAAHLRQELQKEQDPKKFILLYAYNGTGKTRLSMAFKDLGKIAGKGDTLYFNAFTEDLFVWDNDLEDDEERVLKFNSTSSFFSGLKELELENRIRPFLNRYTDFDFNIDYEKSEVRFSRQVQNGAGTEIIDHIKVSRGEENLFIWCFFLAIVQLAMDRAEAYKWVKYFYIDDPISSLDENNAIAVGHDLAQLLARKDHSIQTVISTHHSLFFNVLWNELREIAHKKFAPHFLSYSKKTGQFQLIYTGDTPYFHHLALLKEICEARNADELTMCRKAFEVFSRERYPGQWAGGQNILGGILVNQAQIHKDAEARHLWLEARTAFNSSLEINTPTEFPYPNELLRHNLSEVERALSQLPQ